MEDNVQSLLDVDDFLKQYNVKVDLTDKEKMDILDKICFIHSLDKECEEMIYSKLPECDKTEQIRSEYVSKIQNLEIKMLNARGCYFTLERKIKEECKLKRKETFQKIIGVFKKLK